MVGAADDVVEADVVAPGDMAELVGEHPLQPVHVVGVLNQPRIDEDVLPAGSEGVDLGITDEDDLDRSRIEPGGDNQRPRDVLEQRLGLGVAQHLLGPRRRGQHQRGGERGADGRAADEHARHVAAIG